MLISENESHPSGFSMTEKKFRPWIEKIGVIGFLFFLAKGLVWLAAAGVATLFLR
jgi:hypothetical protein